MLVDFEKLPNTAKIWIYQSSRKFYTDEVPDIIQKVETFLTSWNANGKEIIASYQLKYDRFIIIAVDQALESISVDSIDNSVRFILSLQSEYEIELLDRLNVSFKQGEYVQYKDLKEFKKLIKNKSISDKTVVFNNLIDTKKELEENWEIPITESWHNRFL